jgi:hypothetical protein
VIGITAALEYLSSLTSGLVWRACPSCAEVLPYQPLVYMQEFSSYDLQECSFRGVRGSCWSSFWGAHSAVDAVCHS